MHPPYPPTLAAERIGNMALDAIQQSTGRLILLALICACGVVALDYFWPAKK